MRARISWSRSNSHSTRVRHKAALVYACWSSPGGCRLLVAGGKAFGACLGVADAARIFHARAARLVLLETLRSAWCLLHACWWHIAGSAGALGRPGARTAAEASGRRSVRRRLARPARGLSGSLFGCLSLAMRAVGSPVLLRVAGGLLVRHQRARGCALCGLGLLARLGSARGAGAALALYLPGVSQPCCWLVGRGGWSCPASPRRADRRAGRLRLAALPATGPRLAPAPFLLRAVGVDVRYGALTAASASPQRGQRRQQCCSRQQRRGRCPRRGAGRRVRRRTARAAGGSASATCSPRARGRWPGCGRGLCRSRSSPWGAGSHGLLRLRLGGLPSPLERTLLAPPRPVRCVCSSVGLPLPAPAAEGVCCAGLWHPQRPWGGSDGAYVHTRVSHTTRVPLRCSAALSQRRRRAGSSGRSLPCAPEAAPVQAGPLQALTGGLPCLTLALGLGRGLCGGLRRRRFRHAAKTAL